jgi:hypothetical protein
MLKDDEFLLVGFAHCCGLGPGSEAGGSLLNCSVESGLAPGAVIHFNRPDSSLRGGNELRWKRQEFYDSLPT